MSPKKNDKSPKPQGGKQPAARAFSKNISTFCKMEDGEWFCFKMDGGQAVQCGGPYASRAECEENKCS